MFDHFGTRHTSGEILCKPQLDPCYNLLPRTISVEPLRQAETVTAGPRHIEFFVLSYVPQIVAGGRYEVGLLALERRDERRCFVGARFIPDTKELLAFDPNADTDLLFAFFREIEQRLRDRENAGAFLQTMLDSFSNTIQISDERTVVVSGDPADEIDKLAALYLHRR